jgi:hypothetical protein
MLPHAGMAVDPGTALASLSNAVDVDSTGKYYNPCENSSESERRISERRAEAVQNGVTRPTGHWHACCIVKVEVL